MSWQPIETAPKDPTDSWASSVILVFNGQKVVPAAVDEGRYLDLTIPERDGGWLDVYPDPTHWMPLPEPPKPLAQDPLNS